MSIEEEQSIIEEMSLEMEIIDDLQKHTFDVSKEFNNYEETKDKIDRFKKIAENKSTYIKNLNQKITELRHEIELSKQVEMRQSKDLNDKDEKIDNLTKEIDTGKKYIDSIILDAKIRNIISNNFKKRLQNYAM